MSFWCLHFFQKANLKLLIFVQKIFVRFMEELKTPKRPFEINWPLVFQNLSWFLTSEFKYREIIRSLCIEELSIPRSLIKFVYVLQSRLDWISPAAALKRAKRDFFFSPHSIELRHNGAKQVVKYHLNF